MLQIFSMPCGFLEFDTTLFFPNREKGKKFIIPVPSYLITHPKGNVVFDTGVHCQAIEDPFGRLGEISRMFVSRTKPGEEIVTQLGKFKLTPKDVNYVINSHFHFDHCGGNEFFPDSTIFIQKNEMHAARDPELRKKAFFDPKDFDHKLHYQEVDGEHDIFGDGSLVIIPTHGHTPGHCGVAVRQGEKWLLHAGDSFYSLGQIDSPPSRMPVALGLFQRWADADRGQRVVNQERLRALKASTGREVAIICSHDPTDFDRDVQQ